MDNEFNFHDLKVSERLPSPTGTALAIIKLAQRENATMKELSQYVKLDPALSSRVLRFVNSAAFGGRRPIASVHDAVLMIGLEAVRNFALSLSLIGNHSTGSCREFDYMKYWSKSLAMSVAITAITARERTVLPEEAFTLGLLSDIGRLALATAWPDVYGECITATEEEGHLIAKERESFATDHNALSLMLLADWGLPQIFTDALKLSFELKAPDISRTGRLAGQLDFSRKIADYCLASKNHRATMLPNLQKLARDHNLKDSVFANFLNEVINEWHEWGKLTQVDTTIQNKDPKDTPVSVNTKSDVNTDADSRPDTGLNILLVDDNTVMLSQLPKKLIEAGYRVTTCRNGETVLQHVIEHKPQMVIADWHLNRVDGRPLCKALRTSAFGKNLYLIMLTSTETEDAIVEALDAGVDDYITKPVTLRILLARIRAGHRVVMLQQELERESQDIQHYTAELAAANRRLRVMANTDILTGLPNRRYALTRLEQEWDSARKCRTPMSILMLDLDHFKSVNDTFGHDVGDKVLSHAAKLIKEAARNNDIVCRLGGEEFLVIAPNTDGRNAMMLAERIRRSIEQNQLKELDGLKPITVSIGVAGSVGNNMDWSTLMQLSDKALYSVKQGSRNNVKLATI